MKKVTVVNKPKSTRVGYYFHMGNGGHSIELLPPYRKDIYGNAVGPQWIEYTSDHYSNASPTVRIPILNNDQCDRLIELLKKAKKNIVEDDSCYDVGKSESLAKLDDDED